MRLIIWSIANGCVRCTLIDQAVILFSAANGCVQYAVNNMEHSERMRSVFSRDRHGCVCGTST